MSGTVERIVASGICVGCGACVGCRHITMRMGELGFPVPVIDGGCEGCGQCLSRCIYDPEREDS